MTVIPALMISISGGLIVTRASSDERLGADFAKQMFGNPQPLLLASGVLVVLAAVSGPADACRSCCMGSGLGTAAWRMRKKQIAGEQGRGGCQTGRAPRRIWRACCGSNRWPSKWVWAW